jgi:hypothetical protein
MANFGFIFLLVLFVTACSTQQTLPPEPALSISSATPTHQPLITNSLGVYGNWCGPNHPKNIETADGPIDMLDASCKRHDLCYVEKGQYSCECDKIFNDELSTNLMNDVYQGKQQTYALMFYRYFKGSPCAGVTADKVGPTRLLENIYQGTKNKAASFYDRIIESNDNDAPKTAVEISVSAPSMPTKAK